MALTNAQMYDIIQRYATSFDKETAKGTAEKFATKGFEAIDKNNINQVNEFFGLLMPFVLNMINNSEVRNPLEDSGVFQRFSEPYGMYSQRVTVNPISPVSPAFQGLQNGQSVDMQVVNKPDIEDRFFETNFDFQAPVTIQDFQVKTMFQSNYGVDYLTGSIVGQLRESYVEQEYNNALEAIHTAINSTKKPLKDTQKYQVKSWTEGAPTDVEIRDFVSLLLKIRSAMQTNPRTSAFNAYGFNTYNNPDDHVMLLRAGVLADMKTQSLYAAFNRSDLDLPFPVTEVKDFGGLEYYKEAAKTTKLYPAYGNLGAEIGFNEQQGQSTATVQKDAAYVKDPNEKILAVICKRGMIPIIEKNPLIIAPAPYNVRGLYVTYWASRANTGINYDSAYNLITISKP